MTYKLYGRPGWGSAIVEVQLEWYGLPFEFEALGDLFKDEAARDRLAKVNPLHQVPTLVMPPNGPMAGEVMSESAAITLLLADITGQDSLVPGPRDKDRGRFLRWLVYIVANIYPTFTYADDPSRFVPPKDAQKPFRENVDAYAQRLWRQVEAEATGPWFLGERMSALDIYLGVMTRWRPNRPWFEANTPKLVAAATRVAEIPKLKAVWARNWPAPGDGQPQNT